MGVFDTAESSFFTCTVTCHGTLKPGSSKQGNALRASIDSNWVKTYQLAPSCSLNKPSLPFLLNSPWKAIWSLAGPGCSAEGGVNPANSLSVSTLAATVLPVW